MKIEIGRMPESFRFPRIPKAEIAAVLKALDECQDGQVVILTYPADTKTENVYQRWDSVGRYRGIKLEMHTHRLPDKVLFYISKRKVAS